MELTVRTMCMTQWVPCFTIWHTNEWLRWT